MFPFYLNLYVFLKLSGIQIKDRKRLMSSLHWFDMALEPLFLLIPLGTLWVLFLQVAKGFHQCLCFDYSETLCLIVEPAH